MVAHNGTILLCGGFGNSNKCLKLDHGTWKEHSTLNVERVRHSVVTTQTATFIFGGIYSKTTYEYLPKDSTTWLMGKTKIPSGFQLGSAIVVKSGEEVWLIGGYTTEMRILRFNVNDHTFQLLPLLLNVERRSFTCAFIPNTNKVMVSGGFNSKDYQLDSTEIIDVEDGSVTMASPLNSKRNAHGMGVITFEGKERLVVFGGSGRSGTQDSVEVYDHQTERWETIDIKLREPKSRFGFLNLKLSDVLPNL